ncbi:MAG: GGDEF domain-containing protein [Gammaproteobacteria bacterium]|nr:GGDEF domain-containing protein [Gammaproteobacteria bacterium]
MKLWLKLAKEDMDVPVYRGKLLFLSIAAMLGVIIATGFAVWEWMNGNISRAIADLIFPVTAPFLVYALWYKPRSTQFILHVFALLVFISQVSVGFYLFDFNQLIWLPTYPLIYFYLLGHRGWYWSIVLFIVLWTMYGLYPQFAVQERVAFHVMNNIMVAYLLTATLSWMNSREVLFYQHKIIQRAHYDHLTGVYNRAAWMERAEQEVSSKMRHTERMLSGILLDVDDFKNFNDEYGHHAGDQVLRMVSERLSSRLRKSDILGRWGGEEFIILLPDTGLKQAIEVAENLRMTLYDAENGRRRVSASFGVAEYADGDTLDSMLIRADKHLYRAKDEGKNRVVATLT